MDIPISSVRQFVVDLAKKHNVAYTRTYGDEWAETVTRLAGDEVQTDEVDRLLIALKRAKKITSNDMVDILDSYLKEQPIVRSI